ncbi:hypothetical protein FQN55_005980 [Onygenales sp. PD_40]|nr:hypothetical protein FQN55_005980 [Onygenales sp. PD_40]KAK2772054.1 hypothetical protein FQN53_004794 [Emmonsiellopsis sp. PD_33]KAK2799662.1 hypothetical protein FQN51_006794 [Onygenales sp. PD_10]
MSADPVSIGQNLYSLGNFICDVHQAPEQRERLASAVEDASRIVDRSREGSRKIIYASQDEELLIQRVLERAGIELKDAKDVIDWRGDVTGGNEAGKGKKKGKKKEKKRVFRNFMWAFVDKEEADEHIKLMMLNLFIHVMNQVDFLVERELEKQVREIQHSGISGYGLSSRSMYLDQSPNSVNAQRHMETRYPRCAMKLAVSDSQHDDPVNEWLRESARVRAEEQEAYWQSLEAEE